MENNFMLTDELLWDYADGFLEREERIQVETYLRQHPEYKARLESILTEKRAFKSLNLEMPEAGFAKNVLAAWAAETSAAPAKAVGRDWVLWGLAIGFALVLILPFLLTPASSELSLQIPTEYLPSFQLPLLDWAGLFSSVFLRNALLLAVVFMSLKLFDKYLQVRTLRTA